MRVSGIRFLFATAAHAATHPYESIQNLFRRAKTIATSPLNATMVGIVTVGHAASWGCYGLAAYTHKPVFLGIGIVGGMIFSFTRLPFYILGAQFIKRQLYRPKLKPPEP